MEKDEKQFIIAKIRRQLVSLQGRVLSRNEVISKARLATVLWVTGKVSGPWYSKVQEEVRVALFSNPIANLTHSQIAGEKQDNQVGPEAGGFGTSECNGVLNCLPYVVRWDFRQLLDEDSWIELVNAMAELHDLFPIRKEPALFYYQILLSLLNYLKRADFKTLYLGADRPLKLALMKLARKRREELFLSNQMNQMFYAWNGNRTVQAFFRDIQSFGLHLTENPAPVHVLFREGFILPWGEQQRLDFWRNVRDFLRLCGAQLWSVGFHARGTEQRRATTKLVSEFLGYLVNLSYLEIVWKDDEPQLSMTGLHWRHLRKLEWTQLRSLKLASNSNLLHGICIGTSSRILNLIAGYLFLRENPTSVLFPLLKNLGYSIHERQTSLLVQDVSTAKNLHIQWKSSSFRVFADHLVWLGNHKEGLEGIKVVYNPEEAMILDVPEDWFLKISLPNLERLPGSLSFLIALPSLRKLKMTFKDNEFISQENFGGIGALMVPQLPSDCSVPLFIWIILLSLKKLEVKPAGQSVFIELSRPGFSKRNFIK